MSSKLSYSPEKENNNKIADEIGVIFAGVFSKSRSSERLHSSPESSLRSLAQFRRNLSTRPLHSGFVFP